MSVAYAYDEVEVERHEVKAPKAKRAFAPKPLKGPIDYKALRKSIIGKYPKVLAHLAK